MFAFVSFFKTRYIVFFHTVQGLVPGRKELVVGTKTPKLSIMEAAYFYIQILRPTLSFREVVTVGLKRLDLKSIFPGISLPLWQEP